jgi:hypothetical protein
MKNLVTYYLLIVSPLVILFFLNKNNYITSGIFAISILFYAVIYRTYVDGKRLSKKGIIKNTEIWKLIIPGKRVQYFGDLYFKK